VLGNLWGRHIIWNGNCSVLINRSYSIAIRLKDNEEYADKIGKKHTIKEVPKMTIYKVINDEHHTETEYYLELEKAQKSLSDMMAWYSESFHIESESIEAAV
jgi:hypothetical protein